MIIYTIGCTKCTAKAFFQTLYSKGVRLLIDTRAHNTSQLAGWSKAGDMPYFTTALTDGKCTYEVHRELAPPKALLHAFKTGMIQWTEYRHQFVAELHKRSVDERLTREQMDRACLLCACSSHHECHRSVVAQYLWNRWKLVTPYSTICHLTPGD